MTTDLATPARAREPSLGPRDRLRLKLAELTGVNLTLDVGDVPDLSSRLDRTKWIAGRIRADQWMTSHAAVIAQAWDCSVATVREYAHTAATAIELADGKAEQMSLDAASRILMRAQLAQNEAVAHQADVTILQLTGHLKGGRETPSMTESEREKAIVEWIRDPDEQTVRLLREAFGAASDTLRALLAEFAVVMTEGDER